MKKWGALVLFSLTSTVNAETFSVDIPELQTEAKTVLKRLATTLGGELKKAKKSGGASAAITVCNTKAVALTELVNSQSEWEISRTSLKLRNPDNAPDAWEKEALESFEKKAKIGANLGQLSFSQVVVDEDGRKVFRMMKAIPVAEQCLGCHGNAIKPELSEHLGKLYPEDKATGYVQGDLRGAFSLKKYL
ncbi:MAG: Tll0287-like domain-containing protein [Neptuniibacter sp.]